MVRNTVTYSGHKQVKDDVVTFWMCVTPVDSYSKENLKEKVKISN